MAPIKKFPFVSLIALSLAMPAFAQQPAPQAPPADDQASDVVVVTANKREESVQDIAVAVTAVTSEMRDELGIATVTDLTNMTPGLSYTAANERITLRGIGRNTNNFGAEPGVANYTDGVYQSFATLAGRDGIFVDRIEVLRGPQGTLYGRNSVGGALNIISKRPTDSFEGEFRMAAGNFDSLRVATSVSGPITDWLRYRAVGLKEARAEGTYHNLGTGQKEGYEIDNWTGEIQFEGDIGDNLTWWVKYTTGRYTQEGPPGGRTFGNNNAPYDINSFGSLAGTGAVTPNQYFVYGTSPQRAAVTAFTQCGSTTTNPGVTNRAAMNDCAPRVADLDGYDDFAAEIVYNAGPFDIKYVGGHIWYAYHLYDDQDDTPITSITYNSTSFGAPVPIGTPGSASRTIFPAQTLDYHENRAFFSNELNFISTTDSPLQWIAGLYAYQENFKQPVRTFFPNEPLASSPGVLALNAAFVPIGLAAPNPLRLLSHTNNTGVNNSYGVFVQTDWQFTETLKTTLGVRYSVDNKNMEEEARLFCYIQCSFAPGYSPYTDVTRAIWHGKRFIAANVEDPRPQLGVASASLANPSGVTYNATTGNAERTLKDEWDAVTGTAGLEWSPNSDTLVFGKYSRGYKTGGFNATSMSPNPRTKPEVVNSYEVGWKQTLDSFNLTANSSLFFYDYQDVQVPVTVVPPTGPNFNAFVNIPKVETTGFELESVWRPIDDLNVRFTYAYLKAEVKESDVYSNPITGLAQDVEGNRLPQSPENKVAVNVTYNFNYEDGSSLTPSVSWYWRDSFNSSIFNHPTENTPGYDQTDARLLWNDANGNFTIIGWVRNAFDQEGYDSVSAATRRSLDVNPLSPSRAGIIAQTFTLTPPRTYGVEVQFHF
jgi:iron complex outermembrane recepter protein